MISVLIYILALTAACALQEKILYHPDPTPAVVPDGSPIEAVTLKTEDGESIIAWSMPAQENCPTMLMFHGNGGHLQRGLWQFRKLYDAGVGMFAVSWRGYAGSSGVPSEAGLFADSEAAYAHLSKSGMSEDQIVIHGYSLGSGPATRLAALHESRALILQAPYYSMLDLVERKAPFLPVSWIFRHPYRSDLYIPDVTEPILIAHGGEDTLIPPSQSARLANLATAPTQRIVIEGSAHNTLLRDGLYEDAIWPFLKPLYPECAFGEKIKGDDS